MVHAAMFLFPKFPIGRIAPAFVLMVSLCAAPAEETKSRMVFPAPGGSPTPVPAPSPAPGQTASKSPDDTIKLFFLALQGGNVDAAYDGLVRGTMIAERSEDVVALKERTAQALDGYGPIRGFEQVDSLTVGEHLLRRTCLSLNEDLPLRWRFYFYRSGDTWKLVDLRVDDALVELFEDSARAKK